MTLCALKAEAVRRLKESNIEASALEARLFCSFVLGLDEVSQITNANMEISEEDAKRYLALIEKRAKHIPTAYLTGKKEFYGLDFLVTPDVLIPRSDTETLVDVALGCIRNIERPKVLDLCTGSGCVGIAIASQKKLSSLVLSDISKEALSVASFNAEKNIPSTSFSLVTSNLFDNIQDKDFDLIVSNPPYVRPCDREGLSEEVLNEPHLAIFDSDEDGLGLIRRIVKAAAAHLSPTGCLAIECDSRQTKALSQIMNESGFDCIRTEKDLAGLDRVVSGEKKCTNS